MRVMEGVYITKTPRIKAALSELRQLISERYPTATFSESIRLEPIVGFFLDVTVDVDDTDDVRDVYIDRMIDMQVEDELPVYVWLHQTPERYAAALEREKLVAQTATR